MLISVLGAGSWGSALAMAFSYVAPVKLWARNPNQVEAIKASRINPGYLSENIKFPDNIVPTNDFALAVKSDLLVIATPLNTLRQIFTQIKNLSAGSKIPDIIWVCKGLELDTGLLPHQIAREVFGDCNNIGALLGPSFAHEVAETKPTAIVLASSNKDFIRRWIAKFKVIPNFRVYANTDVIGCEVGSAVKNIMAIAVGISDGLGLGFNARAALMTRSLSELSQLVIALGGRAETIYGLTGVGDLILTCTGDLSRNRKVGLELAKGYRLPDVLNNLGHVAEGVYATQGIYQLSNKIGLTMPIIECVYKILYENAVLLDAVKHLMQREPKLEF